MINASNVTGYIGCARAIRDMSQCDVLGKIKTPSIVIVAESDPACPVALDKHRISYSSTWVSGDPYFVPIMERIGGYAISPHDA